MKKLDDIESPDFAGGFSQVVHIAHILDWRHGHMAKMVRIRGTPEGGEVGGFCGCGFECSGTSTDVWELIRFHLDERLGVSPGRPLPCPVDLWKGW